MNIPLNIEDLWAKGVHVDSKGREWNLQDMPIPYLQNVINAFGEIGYDVSVLKKALDDAEGNQAGTS